MPSPEFNELRAMITAGGVDFSLPPDQVRPAFEAILATIPAPVDLAIDQVQLGLVPALRLRSPGDSESGALLYLHGGAFMAGSARGYGSLAAGLGRACGLTVYSIDYRLAPEHPFPVAIEDACEAYQALLANGVPPARIAVAGDSAGGGLAVGMLLSAKAKRLPMPAACVAISPWADLALEGESMATKRDADPLLRPDALAAAADHYMRGGSLRSPMASPVHADLAGLPPLLVQVGSAEILLDDAVRLCRAAGAADVEARLEIWPHMIHVWHAFSFMLPEGQAAIASAGTFLNERLQTVPARAA